MKALLERATRTERDRKISYSWVGPINGDGDAPAIRLTFCHEKDRKRYSAEFWRYMHEQRDGYSMERFTVNYGRSGLADFQRITVQPCGRYSDKGLRAFHDEVLSLLAERSEVLGDAVVWLTEIADLVEVTA